jgi:hypothetical protein
VGRGKGNLRSLWKYTVSFTTLTLQSHGGVSGFSWVGGCVDYTTDLDGKRKLMYCCTCNLTCVFLSLTTHFVVSICILYNRHKGKRDNEINMALCSFLISVYKLCPHGTRARWSSRGACTVSEFEWRRSILVCRRTEFQGCSLYYTHSSVQWWHSKG